MPDKSTPPEKAVPMVTFAPSWMTEADYLARTGVVFFLPVHPGDAPVHQATATGLQIAEIICLFNQHVNAHQLFDNVQTQLKQQLLKAVEYRYLQFLEDPDFGVADVLPRDMLQHLQAIRTSHAWRHRTKSQPPVCRLESR
jgi:hypothetical protein